MTEENVTNTETPMEQSPTSQEEAIDNRERAMFTTHVESSGEQIPANFKDAGAWFDSLKEAQKKMTKTSQENAELKRQLETPVAADAAPPEPPAETEAPITDELRIPAKQETKPTETEELKKPEHISPDTYEAWYAEFAVNGEFSSQTKEDIKKQTGFTDRMLDDYTKGQKARLRESYDKAADSVGGNEKLAKIFRWASDTMSQDELQAINLGLASNTYEVTLKGLAAMYDAATIKKREAEPTKNPNLAQVAASQAGIVPYATQREFKSERNNPEFELNPKYREMVQARMSMTDWNKLPV
tara:strand:+ start:918 stop:1817 length:900 start_codon:yes stop_codon:yes gene_type:complete